MEIINIDGYGKDMIICLENVNVPGAFDASAGRLLYSTELAEHNR